MGEIIQFATGEEVASAIASANQQVSGMTPTEAWNAMNLRETGKMGAGDYLSQGGNNVLNFPNQEAGDAFNSYVEGGGGTSGAGAAAAGAAKTFQLTSFLKNGVSKAGAILSISLPQAAAAIAPLLGVAVGAGLYKLSPDLWTKISKTLLPFCWEGTENLPGIVGEDGQVYISGAAIDAVKQTLDDLGVGKEGDKTSSLDTGNIVQPIPSSKTFKIVTTKDPTYSNEYRQDIYELVSVSGNVAVTSFIYSGTRFRVLISYDEGGNAIYRHRILTYDESGALISDVPTDTVLDASTATGTYQDHKYGNLETTIYNSRKGTYEVADIPVATKTGTGSSFSKSNNVSSTVLYGDSTTYYPDGTSKYGGNIPSNYTEGAISSIINSSGNTEPYYPVYIPVGDPGVTTDPSVNPNPQSPNEFPDLTPLIKPEVNPNQYPQEVPVPTPAERTNPLPSPATNPQPSFDPSDNPSVRPNPIPSTEPAPTFPIETPEDSPISSGDSPSTIFPLPNQDWPAIVPTTGSGLIHVYNPTNNEMVAFGNWLWVTYADKDIDKIWNNPFDGVISAHELYATPQTDGTDSIRSGFLTCPTTAKLVRVRYTTIDCGSIIIPEFYQNYLDYAPYTKAHVYLPFVGIVELDADDIVGHAVNIKYHVDSYNGSCIAQITVAKSDYSNTVYQFSGNCAVELPLAGGSQASIRAGMIMAAASGLTSVVGGIASAAAGSIGGAVGSLVSGAGSVAGHLVSQKSSVQHSGSFGASFGAMGIKKPYIIIRRPIQKEVTNYNIEYGFPAHKKVTIGSCTGYLRVLEVHVKSPTATDEEKRAIEEALKNGIFVT